MKGRQQEYSRLMPVDRFMLIQYQGFMDHNETYKLRKRLGWTQDKLAEYLGVSQPTVARIESGFSASGPVLKLLALLEGKVQAKERRRNKA